MTNHDKALLRRVIQTSTYTLAQSQTKNAVINRQIRELVTNRAEM